MSLNCQNGSGTSDHSCLTQPRTTLESAMCAVLLILTCLATLCGNGLVIWVLMKSWYNTVSKPANYLVLHLAIVDLLNGLVEMPLGTVSVIAGEWIFGDALCKMSGFLLVLLTTTSNTILSMISVNRYYRVLQPNMRQVVLRRRAFLMALLSWMCGLVAALAVSSGWGNVGFTPGLDINCIMTWDTSAKSLTNMIFTCSLFFVMPFGIMVVTYCRIFSVVRKRVQRVQPERRVTWTGSDVPESRQSVAVIVETRRRTTLFGNTNFTYSLHRTESRTAVTLAIVLGIFAVCWIPVAVLHIVRTGRRDLITPHILATAIVLMYLSPACNPVVYSLRNSAFRAEIWDILGCFHKGTQSY